MCECKMVEVVYVENGQRVTREVPFECKECSDKRFAEYMSMLPKNFFDACFDGTP